MEYISLRKLYYMDETLWQEEFEKRYNSFGTKHFGVIINQYNRTKGYEAFLCYTDEIIELIEKIYALNTEFVTLKNSLPDMVMQQFVLKCITEEIKSTNDIEGVRSTRREIRAWLEHLPETEKTPHLKSVIEKYSSICEGDVIPFYSCKDIRNFYDGFVLDEVLGENELNAPDGQFFRSDQVEIQGAVIGKVVHKGLYPEPKIVETMERALAVLHDNKLSAVLRIAVFHYLFAYIHPFYNGNGRTDRFISSYYVSKYLNPLVAYRLSYIIKKHKSQYYKMFTDTNDKRNKGDLTPFIIQFLEFVLEVEKELCEEIENRVNKTSYYTMRLKELSLTELDDKIAFYLMLNALFDTEGLSVSRLQIIVDKSYNTVKKSIDRLQKMNLLRTETSGKSTLYEIDLNKI